MASTVALGRLFKALGVGDLQEASLMAREIAESEDRRGHRSAAALLRGALNPNGRGVTSAQQLAVAVLDPQAALIEEQPGPSLSDVVLTRRAHRDLTELITEWTHRALLTEHGLSRRTKVLFFGPPGCGKTLAARSVGSAMRLPVLTVRFSSVVGAYLGQTGSHLRSVFRFAESNSCILLLDEFDAVARRRGRSDEVGELDRVVISLLQELDHTVPAGLVIAATNAPESLDRAIWRRFDARVEFPAPTRKQLASFANRSRTSRLPKATSLRDGLPRNLRSFADVEAWVGDLRRQNILRTLTKANGKTR